MVSTADSGLNRCNAKLRKQLKRAQVSGFLANLPPCLIGMEAGASAHFWARKLTALGSSARIRAFAASLPFAMSPSSLIVPVCLVVRISR